jgi:hypothetical protein
MVFLYSTLVCTNLFNVFSEFIGLLIGQATFCRMIVIIFCFFVRFIGASFGRPLDERG